MAKLRFVKSRVWCGEEARVYRVLGEDFAGLLIVDTQNINGDPTIYVYDWSIDTMWTADTPPKHLTSRLPDEKLGRADPFESALKFFGYEVAL